MPTEVLQTTLDDEQAFVRCFPYLVMFNLKCFAVFAEKLVRWKQTWQAFRHDNC
jgi:hypothetical protein